MKITTCYFAENETDVAMIWMANTIVHTFEICQASHVIKIKNTTVPKLDSYELNFWSRDLRGKFQTIADISSSTLITFKIPINFLVSSSW